MFVEQLGRDNAKPVDVPLGFDPDHFGHGREFHKDDKDDKVGKDDADTEEV